MHYGGIVLFIQSRAHPYPHACQRRLCYLHLPIVLTLVLTLLLGVASYLLPLAYAGSNTPIIFWDSSMIMAGQNNGNPWGPPGEEATVHGQNFNFRIGQQLNLVLVVGNSNSTPSLCHGSSTSVGQVTVVAPGNFNANFIWPATLNQVGHLYSICALAADTAVISTHDGSGPFTVLSANPPGINVSSTSVAPSGTITVTGQNWVPPQQVQLDVTSSQSQSPIATADITSNALLTGTFSATLTIPANTAPGTYTVTAFTPQSNLLNVANTNGQQALTVTSTNVATPTPVATPTTVATATTTANQTPSTTPTTVANSSGGNNGNSSGGNNKTLLFILLIALAAVILAIGGLLLFMLAQKKVPLFW